jgi:uncharacterized membrane protein YciS (DUF1049 family)
MIVLKLLLVACALVFIFVFIRVLLENDQKFGRFNWKVALACASFSTVLLVLRGLEFVVSIPFRIYLYLKDLSSRGRP